MSSWGEDNTPHTHTRHATPLGHYINMRLGGEKHVARQGYMTAGRDQAVNV